MKTLEFDTLCRNDYGDQELVGLSTEQGRILLSKDEALLDNERIIRCYQVREKHPWEQFTEILERFVLFRACHPLQRCIRCNTVLEGNKKLEVIGSLPSKVVETFNEFRKCPVCRRVYWKGSHFARMNAFATDVLNSGSGSYAP